MLLRQNVQFMPADTVFAGAGAAHRYRAHADTFGERLCAFALRGIGAVEEYDEMEIAVADVPENRRRQTAFLDIGLGF